jgi:hypothetical protein
MDLAGLAFLSLCLLMPPSSFPRAAARARDEAGNTGISPPVFVDVSNLDTTAPTVVITSP